jgi:exopolysaccharide production protein ExoZ
MPELDRSSNRNFHLIQVLRAFAAYIVIVCHSTNLWATDVGTAPRPAYWPNGAAGVDIFFVISGFVMAVSTLGKGEGWPVARSFMERRLIRIMPMYWLVTFLTLGKMLASAMKPELGLNHSHTAYSPMFIITSLLLIPAHNSSGGISPVVEPGWTLSFEMLFYILLAAALGFRKNAVKFIAGILIVLSIIGLFYNYSWPAFTRLCNPILLEFLAGLILGRAVLGGFKIKAIYCLPVGLASLVALLFLPISDSLNPARILGFGIPAFLIVLTAVMAEEEFGKYVPLWALFIGDASYSLYLLHTIVNSAVGKFLIRVHIPPQGVLLQRFEVITVLACLLVTSCVAFVVYRFVERPMTEMLRQWLKVGKMRRDAVAEAKLAESIGHP